MQQAPALATVFRIQWNYFVVFSNETVITAKTVIQDDAFLSACFTHMMGWTFSAC